MAMSRQIAIWGLLVAVLVAWHPGVAHSEQGDATLQERFASKEGRLYGHATGSALIRDDFYRSLGVGVDAGYYFDEFWGMELRAQRIFTQLSHTGEQMAADHGIAPDMRAPSAFVAAGARFSWGYGKVLTAGDFLVHFDPQLISHAGVTIAEERVVPTMTAGIGFLSHWPWGIQAQLDLQVSLHAENRDRGVVIATGFAPMFSVGWSFQPGEW